jgi:uncharacterized membrane protein
MPYFKLVMLWLMGILYVAAGINHFVRPVFYAKIMPPYLPWPFELIYASGIAEIVLGLLVLLKKWRSPAAWGLIALLIAVFPANIHMAWHSELYPNIPPVLLWVRLPLQFVLMAWAYWFTGSELQGEIK